jgi:hypothetical protein
MSLDEIEQRLAAAQERLKVVTSRMAVEDQAWWGEYKPAEEAVLGLERELAAVKGEEHAVPLDFPVRWDIGAPLHCFAQLLYGSLPACCSFFRSASRTLWTEV